MKYNPEIHHRKSIRLKNYDYSQRGFYFITICTQHHIKFFGKIESDKIILNNAGEMVKGWYYRLEEKFSNLKCHEMVIMPNHMHCIIEILVGADPSICPEGEHIGSPLRKITLAEIIAWFKTMTTNEYIRNIKENNWQPFKRRLWQRNYFEHIIRNEDSYKKIAEYIVNNPINWEKDKYYI